MITILLTLLAANVWAASGLRQALETASETLAHQGKVCREYLLPSAAQVAENDMRTAEQWLRQGRIDGEQFGQYQEAVEVYKENSRTYCDGAAELNLELKAQLQRGEPFELSKAKSICSARENRLQTLMSNLERLQRVDSSTRGNIGGAIAQTQEDWDYLCKDVRLQPPPPPGF